MEDLMRARDGAEAFVDSLNAQGVDHIFLNPGIDTTPVQGAVAKYKALGKKAPRIVLCPDESVAFAAAHGYAMVSGKPQVVMVFSDIGTLQVGGALANASSAGAPVVLCAGRSGNDGFNWRQEPYDQGGIVRNYVKWDHELRPGENVVHTLEKALEIAGTAPRGLVYLCIHREVLTGKLGQLEIPAQDVPDGTSPSQLVDARDLEMAAQLLIDAQNPLILSAAPSAQAVAALVAIAEAVGARAITTENRMGFPSTHPLSAGIDSAAGNCYDQYIKEADVVLLVDYVPPGPRPKTPPPAGAKIIAVETDPNKVKNLRWGRSADVLLQAESSNVLPALSGMIKELQAGTPAGGIKSRFERLRDEHQRERDAWQAMALNAADDKPISTEWLCHCINEAIGEQDIIVNMAIAGGASVARQIKRSEPETLFGPVGISIGWPLPAALGAKLAAPDKMVVSILGDGGFIYGCPTATLWSARVHNAPFLTVIFDNQGYNAIRSLMRTGYGEDTVAGGEGLLMGTDFRTPPEYAKIAEACGAYGRMVDDPAELQSALKEAVDQVRRGTPAVLDVKI